MVGTGTAASYAIVRFRPYTKAATRLFFYFVMGHMVTAEVVAVAVFLQMWFIGGVDSIVWLSLVYCASGLPFVIILCRGFFSTVAKDLFDAAEIDGCSEIRLFGSVMLPLSKPVVASAIIYQFTYVWNEFILGMMLIQSSRKLTLPIGVFRLVMDKYQTDYTAAFAAITITSIPVVLVYLVSQKQFVGGLGGGIKG